MDLKTLVEKNQSIKIVPSIEESLSKSGFNTKLDDETIIWLYSLKKTWNIWKKSFTVESHIETFLQSNTDPYRTALTLVIKCEEYKDSKQKSLPYCIIETLEITSNKLGLSPEENIKLPAFQIAIQQRNLHFISLVIKTYKIVTIKNIILPIVKDMIKHGNHKQAAQIIIAIELFSEIPVQDLLFPLVLQDKTSLVDEYLNQCPSQVEPFLSFLDQILDKSFNIREFAQNYIETNNVTNVKYNKLHYKPLGKLVARLCNKFNIPISTCKNLSKNRTSGGLRYLVYQKYSENNISPTVWDDLVRDALNQNADSALDFIDFLAGYDKKEALKWAEYLNIPHHDYPRILKLLSNENTTEEQENWDNEPEVSQDFYKLSLEVDKIIIIDNAEKFNNMIATDLKDCTCIGIDCEWKPSFGATISQVAIIQISTKDAVYLIDTIVLNKQELNLSWCAFNKHILDNAEIIKVGFGLEQDLKEIKSSIIGLSNIKIKGEGLLDLALLWKTLTCEGLHLPYHGEGGGASLSCLVQSCFNLPLEKSEQCSNWELRPLRQTQIVYAALDAYVLMELYLFLQNVCHEQKINFDEICNDVMLDVKQKNSKKNKISDRLLQSSSGEHSQRRTVSETKFLLDPKLSFLSSQLRYFGMDTVLISPSMLWHDVINYAISEDRFILLSKMKLSPSTKFPQNSIFEVATAEIKDQLQRIMDYFKINVIKSNFLSRCVYCNYNKLKKLSVDDINNLHTECKDKSALNTPKYATYDDEEGDYDNFFSDSDNDEDLYQQPTHTVKHSENVNYVQQSYMSSMNISIDINAINYLQMSKKEASLCEGCGKLLWEGEELIKTFDDLLSKLNIISVT